MRARLGTSDLIILVVSGVAVVVLATATFLIAPVDSPPRVPASSYSAEPEGVKAAYLVLKELGHEVARSLEPIAALKYDPSTTTLVLAHPIERPSKGDQQALSSFVRQGGVVIAFGLSADAFLPGVTPNRQYRRDRTVEVFRAALPGQLTRGTRELSAYRSPTPSLDPAYLPVYGDGDNLAVVTARFGDGQVIWCLDNTVIQNDGITRGANVNLIANAAGVPGVRTIAWDEHYHGERRSFWSYLAGTPLIWGGAQLGLVALALLAATSRRRGPLRPRTVEPRTSPLEFVDTMAALYERADDARAAVEVTRVKLRRRLAVVSGLPISTGDEQLVAIAAPRAGLDPDRTGAALAASADVLRRGVARGKDVVSIVAELQELTALTTAGGRGHVLRAGC